MIGGAGNDIINGGHGTDTLMGGTGNDTLDGGVGNNTFTGGQGNDILNGASGNDTDLFNAGDGSDTMQDSGSVEGDILRLGAGLLAADTVLSRVDNVLVLNWAGNSGDAVTLQLYFYGASYQIEHIHFADGTQWGIADIASRLIQNGTTGNDTIAGMAGYANLMQGPAANGQVFLAAAQSA